MHTPILGNKRVLKILAVGLGVIIAFACGWFVSQVQNVNRVSPREIWVNNWITEVTELVHNGRDTKLVTPDQTQSNVVSGLNIDSHTMALVYDTLSPDLKKRVLFWIPAARAIATAQQGPASLQDRRYLLKFVDCVHAVQIHGGSVRACFRARHDPSASR